MNRIVAQPLAQLGRHLALIWQAKRYEKFLSTRSALAKRGVARLHPLEIQSKGRDPLLYMQRYKIENMLARLKYFRCIHTRYDRCTHTYLSAIFIVAAVASRL
jgi:transposase